MVIALICESMGEAYHDPRSEIPHEITEGQVYADSRGDESEKLTLLYVDNQIALMRSNFSNDSSSGSYHRIDTRAEFEKYVGSGRYTLKSDEESDAANMRAFSEALAALTRVRDRHDVQNGRVHQHKAEGIEEALTELEEVAGDADIEQTGSVVSEEMEFEDIGGVGEQTAENLREKGFSTKADVAAASDSELLDVGGVGQKVVERMRERVESDANE